MKRFVSVRCEVEVDVPPEDLDAVIAEMVVAVKRAVDPFGSVGHAAVVKRKTRGQA